MKLPHFVALVFLAASLIVIGVHTSGVQNQSSADDSVEKNGRPPEHFFFVSDHDLDSRIECPLARLDDRAEIWSRGITHCTLAEGWNQPQAWGAWATGLVSRVDVKVNSSLPRVLMIKVRANNALAADLNQMISVSVNEHVFEAKPVSKRWTNLRYRIPRGVLQPGSNSIELRFTERISPSQSGAGKDPTTFAARITQLTLQAPKGRSSKGWTDNRGSEVWDDAKQAFLIDDPGTLLMPVFVPENSGRMDLEVVSASGEDDPALQAVVSIEGLDGVEQGQVEIEIEPGEAPRTARLQVGDLAGQWALATIQAPVDGGELEVSRPRFAPDHRKPTAHHPRPERDRATSPDVILITLDAARADRFSFAGHPRRTTPFIDRLARESLVFENAFALVPYTLASVPTMITGLSFIDHGVLDHEDVLSQDAVTLAEILAQSGYHTACFSATPNNSRAKGFDQGYEVFREVWTEGAGRKENRRARFMAKTVIQWLDTIEDDDRPLHLQVHMVPPHAPYDPAPQFDIFTDPDYDGPCDGYNRTLFALDGGSMEATAECIDHLLNLYDGNLKAADRAVERILTALRERPRWRDTIVLVTSDHGEAFWEHRQLGHNSTLYAEMLHVPFVLRMPEGFDGSSIDTGRLATLADIVPTMLSGAGLPVPRFKDGRDLLDADPTANGRFYVGQTATKPPVQSVRTLRWSLMVNAAGSGALFDLSTDPGEHRNVAADHPMQYIGLGKIMSDRLRQPAELAATVAATDITDEERVLLETLGYIID